MGEDHTARLELPLLTAGQAQKEIDHNEALTLLDLAVQAAVIDFGRNVPPTAPEGGACWIVGDAPVAEWAGRAGCIAGWTAAGWRFVEPRPGMTVWSIADGYDARHDGTGWQIGEVRAARLRVDGIDILGPRQPAIADVSGGTTIDAEARAAIAAIVNTLRAHRLIAP